MTNERDDELRQLLNGQAVPPHGPDFWTDLDAALAAEPTPVGASTNEVAAAGPSDDATEIELEADDATVTSISSHPRFQRWGMALIGAAAVALAVVVGMSLIDRDDGPPPTGTNGGSTSVPTVPEETVLVEPGVDYSQIEQTIALGSGAVAGWTPDGSGVLVVDDAPGEELGAEGTELLTLYVRPIDGGDPYPAFADDRTIQTGGADFAYGRNGDVAWAEWCDSSSCALSTGQMQPDGTIRAVTEIPLPDIAEPAISDLEWGEDGTLYFALNGSAYMVNMVDVVAESLGGDGVRLLTPTIEGFAMVQDGSGLGVQTGANVFAAEVGPLSSSPTGLGLATASSTGATASEIAVVPVGPYDGGISASVGQLDGLAWAPADDTVFWYGDGLGSLTIDAGSDGGSEVTLLPPGQRVFHASVSPDGTALAVTTINEGMLEAEVLVFGSTSDDANPAPPDAPAGLTPIGLIDGVVVGLLDDETALVLRDELVAADFACDSTVTPAALWQIPLDGSEPTLLASPTGNRAL